MAGNATLTLLGLVTSLRGGTKTLSPSPISSAASPATNTVVTLTSGANTIAVPSGAVCALILPPSGNTVAITAKGVAGDTGIRLHNANWSLISLDPSQATFVLNAGSTVSGLEVWFV